MHNGIGIVLFMHCNLGQAFLDALQENNGYYNPAQFKAVSFTYQDDMQAKEIELIETMRAVEKGNGVIVLTDSIGGAIGHLAVAVRSKLENEGKKAEGLAQIRG
jgi:PTS system mannose-specific IIA component